MTRSDFRLRALNKSRVQILAFAQLLIDLPASRPDKREDSYPEGKTTNLAKLLKISNVKQAGNALPNQELTRELGNWFFVVTRKFHAPIQTRRAQPHNRLKKPWLKRNTFSQTCGRSPNKAALHSCHI